MAIKMNVTDVPAEDAGPYLLQRLIPGDGTGKALGVSVGIVDYKPLDGPEPDIGPAHDGPEVLYVLSGAGVLAEPSGKSPLRAGDAFAIEPGTPHRVWPWGNGRLVMLYVSISVGIDHLHDHT